MGFGTTSLLPACDNMCVCCPALRPSSRRPKKRYKMLLAEIFPKTPDGPPNERKIVKLCEYAAKNPFRIPKIATFLEQRSYKELRTEQNNSIKIITDTYSKLLYICKDQMAYFAGSLLNVIVELLDNKQHDAIQILGCQTLTRLIYSQADTTYARNIESLVHKVCMLANENGEEHKTVLRAASLECLLAMVWYITKYSFIFADFDEIVHAILQNYGSNECIEDNDERRDVHHNWVDEVVRCEGRGVLNDVSSGAMAVMPRPETKDSTMLTREERENPVVWSHICIQKMAELAKESTTLRRLLEPMFIYFDTRRHWTTRRGLALHVLSDMSYLVEGSGNEKMILAAIIRHLDHKNVLHDPQVKFDIVQIATFLVRQLSSRAVVAEIGIASDLCRHLRKSLQSTMESVGKEDSKWNITLQNSIEDCLLEIAKGIRDTYPLFDIMAIALEKLPAIGTACRATIGSLLILAHIISLTTVHSHSQLETNVIMLSEDQTTLLLSSLWMQANQPDNLPSNFEAISHSFSMTLISSCLKNTYHSNTIHFFQLPLSLINASLDLNGTLSPSCQRSLLTLAIGMLAFAGKVYHINELTESLKILISLDVDPYLFFGEDLQIYLRTRADFKEFASDTDQLAAASTLADLRKVAAESGLHLIDMIVQGLSNLADVEKDELVKQLCETFTPEVGTIPTLSWDNLQYVGVSEESFSFDEEHSKTNSIEGDISPATDLPSAVSTNPTYSSLPQVISVGQLLESALHVAGQVAVTSISTSPLPYGTMTSQCESLGMCTRKKLATWLVSDHDSIPEDPLPALRVSNHSVIAKMDLYGVMGQNGHVVSEPLQALRLPPASPFDNFMRAAGC